jgi:glutathione S-transferase
MITVHTIIGSPFGRAAIIACLEKGASYRVAPVKPGEHKGPAYLAMQPFGRIPAIEDDGFVLYETQAILRYLDAVGSGPSLAPTDPKAAARMNQAMGIIDWYFFSPTGAVPLVFNRVVAPKIGVPVNEAAALAAIPATRHVLSVLGGFVEEHLYFGGDIFSLADIHVGTQIDMLSETPEAAELLADSPLVAWLDRVRARRSFAATTWDELAKAA